MKKVLITGFNGFVGRYASREFKARGYEIHGVTNGTISDEAKDIVDRISICDLSDLDATKKLEVDTDVDVVLNLAGFATNTSTDTELIHRINVGVHVNLCKLLGSLGLNPTYIGVSSSTVYRADQHLPLTELSELKDPDSARPYEASKIAAEHAMSRFTDAKIIIARPFNHIGPGQSPGFLVPDLAGQALQAKQSSRPMMVGNLNSKRDYTHVADVARAYADLAEMQAVESGNVFNICSGRSISGHEILRALLKAMEIGDTVKVEVDPSKLRGASDIDDNYGSYDKIHQTTGWSPSEDGVDRAITEFAKDFLAKNRI